MASGKEGTINEDDEMQSPPVQDEAFGSVHSPAF